VLPHTAGHARMDKHMVTDLTLVLTPPGEEITPEMGEGGGEEGGGGERVGGGGAGKM
jgi:hypothetical protein